MLHELRVENLLLIERAELRLGPGLNVLTGETGAGKTVLAHALDLLLGGKPRPGIVRPGAAEAYVEGVFALPDALREALGDRLPEDADELVLARRVSAEGRTRAYLGGRSATAADLREVGGALLSFYGQHEHRKLTLASAQLEILDGFCGPEQAARRAAFAAAYARERELRDAARGAARAGRRARPRARPARVGAARRSSARTPSEAEEAELRGRARAAAPRRGAARRPRPAAPAALAGDDEDGGGAALALAAAAHALEAVGGVDAELDALADRVAGAGARGRRPGRTSCAATARASRRRRAGSTRSRSGSRCSTGSSASTAARSRRCSRTPRTCRARRDELAGAEEALEAGEARARGRAGRARRAAPRSCAPRAREAAGRARPTRSRERLAALAMEGAEFDGARRRARRLRPDAAATRSSS